MKVNADVARRWLMQVVQQTGRLPTEIARDAGLNSTTLTRPLNDPSYKGALSFRTLRAVSQATGVPLPAELGVAPSPVRPAAQPQKPDAIELSVRLAKLLPPGVELDDATRTEIIREIVALAGRFGLLRGS